MKKKAIITLTRAPRASLEVGMKIYLHNDEEWTIIGINNTSIYDIRRWGKIRVWFYMRWFYLKGRIHSFWFWLNNVKEL